MQIPSSIELLDRWIKLAIEPSYLDWAQLAAREIFRAKDRYVSVEKETGVPWWFVGAIHYRESDFNWKTHLANGDPLFDKQGFPIATTHVPEGLGPFQHWEQGAIAAIRHVGFDKIKNWDIVSALKHAESWNGHAYEHHDVESPYVWAGTPFYTKGHFVADGHFDANAVDIRPGVAVILDRLKQTGVAYVVPADTTEKA